MNCNEHIGTYSYKQVFSPTKTHSESICSYFNDTFRVQFSSVAQSCLTLCDPMDCSTPGFPVHQQLPEFAQTHVHWVNDAIQPSHPLSSPSPPAFNLSQHQGLFQWVSSSNQVAKVLEFQLQPQSFQWIFRLISFRIDWLDLLAVQGTLKILLQHHSSKVAFLVTSMYLSFLICTKGWIHSPDSSFTVDPLILILAPRVAVHDHGFVST